MIPVLFESTETKFDTSVSNGLGRLYEATSCICTEKRNGEYYLTMEYPFASEMYKYLEKGRYILAEPSSNYRPQPFEIDTISRPMGGIVTVTAWHISDHLRYIPVMPFTASSCVDALNKLKTYSSEPNPFMVWTDKNVTAPFTNKVPRSFKACLGGEENSLLDVFGTAEYEFDMYNVKMHLHRGKNRGVTVRYGVNLIDLKQEDSIANTVTGITPYWHGTIDQKDVTVVLPEKNIQSDKAGRFPYHRTEAVDLSSVIKLPEKVKQPTVEMLREAAKTYMKGKSYGVPDVSLTVSYEDLAGTEEYSSDETLQVNLCDTITVIFENLNVNATAEVISVEYDVLKEAYTKLELGSYKDTLSKIIYQNSIMQNNLVSAVKIIEDNSSDTESRLIAEYVKQNQIILDDTKATTDALSKKLDAETSRATNAENANNKLITDHKEDTSNPHKVTKSQVGLGNVDNTADSAKSVKYAASAGSANSVAWGNVSGKPSTFPPSGHTHTKDQVGLSNVDNTSDVNKPVSTAVQSALNNKVTKSNTADTNGLLNSLASEVSTPMDADYYISQHAGGGTTTTTYHRRPMSALWTFIKSKCDSIYATISTVNAHISNKSNPHGVTKSQVGLGNVDNTADSAKSVKYAASAGSANSVAWGNVSGKPSTFPPSGHTHTKDQVGLSNVDNTADSAKSVKYAASAGSANSVAWGNVSGKPSTFPPSGHTHSYLPLSGGTVTGALAVNGKLTAAGRLISPTNGGPWVSGKDVNNAVLCVSTQAASPGSRWDPIIAQKDYAGGTWNIGSICNQVGIAGFYKDRTANGNDWYHYIDTTNGTMHFDKQVYANVTGSLSGNASTATKATQDSSGQQIDSTYIKNLSVSGRTITYTRGNGKTGAITTQDTNTNTTYTLTKSGYTITLNGSDGSKTSVSDAIGDTTAAISNDTIDSICV